MTAILIPLSVFIGVGASAIGTTAWPLVVPVLFVFFGFDLYATLFVSLTIDFGNALIMCAIAGRHRYIDYRKGIHLTAFALAWIAAGIYLGAKIIPQHQDLFRGSAGYATMILGALFLRRGYKMLPRNAMAAFHSSRQSGGAGKKRLTGNVRSFLLYVGVALMAFQVGLFGIGGGMGFAVCLMACLSFPVLKATGTAMLITAFSAFFAAAAFFFQIPEGEVLRGSLHWILLVMMAGSAVGTVAGARVTYSMPAHQINFMIGGVVFAAGLLAAIQSWIFST